MYSLKSAVGIMILSIILGLMAGILILDPEPAEPIDPVALMTLDVLAEGDLCFLTPADTVKRPSELECIVDGEYAPLWECYYPQACELEIGLEYCLQFDHPSTHSECDPWRSTNL